MENRGLVSIWIGNFNSMEDLKNYVCLGYTADGDQIFSKFANEFDFGHTDDDSIEYEFYNEKLVSIKEMLEPFSYGKIISDRYMKFLGINKFDKPVNSIILLFDFKYEENIVFKSNDIEFVGCVSYL